MKKIRPILAGVALLAGSLLLAYGRVNAFISSFPPNHDRQSGTRIAASAVTSTVFNVKPRNSLRTQDNGTRKSRRKQLEPPMPVVGYDVDYIREYYDIRPFHVSWRLNSLGLPLLGWYFGLLFDRLIGIDQEESVQRKRGEELRGHLVHSGSVALIKFGQAISLRPDLLQNKIWAEELAKLVDAVGPFSDVVAMKIVTEQLSDLSPRLESAKDLGALSYNPRKRLSDRKNKIEAKFGSNPIFALFEFTNDNRAVASASVGQVYKATIKRGPMLEAAVGKKDAALWGGKTVSIKVQRPDVAASAALDMYLIRRAAEWLSLWSGGNLPAIADQFGMQLFGELDYIREAHNGERFKALYGDWESLRIPSSCTSLTRKKVLVTEWVEGVKGPWPGEAGINMVRTGLQCSVDQLLNTGIFHADPHKGNLLMTPDGKLGYLDFGMMADVPEEDRYGLIGLIIGLQNKDLPLVTENLLKLGFLKDSTQVNVLVPRLQQALEKSTGGTGKASDVNFAQLQSELDQISRDNVLKFSTPPFFTIIIRSLIILEGQALSVDKNFRLVRGAYPFVLAQLLSPDESGRTPASLSKLLTYLLTVGGEGQRIEWDRLREFLRLAQKASRSQAWSDDSKEQTSSSRQTIDLFFEFLTSRTGLFLKTPLVHEVAEAIDGVASLGEANLLRLSRGLIRPPPGGNGPVNERRIEEIRGVLDMITSALVEGKGVGRGGKRLEAVIEMLQDIVTFVGNERRQREAAPILAEIYSVMQLVAVEILEIRGSRAMRSVLKLIPAHQ